MTPTLIINSRIAGVIERTFLAAEGVGIFKTMQDINTTYQNLKTAQDDALNSKKDAEKAYTTIAVPAEKDRVYEVFYKLSCLPYNEYVEALSPQVMDAIRNGFYNGRD